jgi:hypothetical protein
MKKKTVIVALLLVCVTVGVAVALRMKQNAGGASKTSLNAGLREVSSLSAARAEWLTSISENWDNLISKKNDAVKIRISDEDWSAFETILAIIKADREVIMSSQYSSLFLGYTTDDRAALYFNLALYPLTEEKNDDLQKVADYFRNENNRVLDLIRVEKDQITFDTTFGYALVYVDTDKKPKHLSKPYDESGKSILTEKIRLCHRWCHKLVYYNNIPLKKNVL